MRSIALILNVCSSGQNSLMKMIRTKCRHTSTHCICRRVHTPATHCTSFLWQEVCIEVLVSTFVQWGLSHLLPCRVSMSIIYKKYKPSCVPLLALKLSLSPYGFPLVSEQKSYPYDDLRTWHDLALLLLSASSLLPFSPTGFLLEP